MPEGDIKLASNFSLKSQRPLIDTEVVATITERNAIEEIQRYNLMFVSIDDGTNKLFQLVSGTVDTDLTNNLNWVERSTEVEPTHTGDVTGDTDLTIALNAVTYAKMQDMVAMGILGIAASGGEIAELTTLPANVMGNIAITISQITDFVTNLNKLYQPDGTNAFVYTDNGGALHIDGDIIQTGSAYETHLEQVYTKDDLIITRDGAVGGLGVGEYTGIQAYKYDGTNSGQLVFDSTGVARVGDIGSTQALATREDSPTNGYYARWNSTIVGFETINLDVIYAQLAGNTTQVFNVEAATADDHAVSRTFGDSRYTQYKTAANSLPSSTGVGTIDFNRVNDYYSEIVLTGNVIWGISSIGSIIDKVIAIDCKVAGYSVTLTQEDIIFKGAVNSSGVVQDLDTTKSNLISIWAETATIIWVTVIKNEA